MEKSIKLLYFMGTLFDEQALIKKKERELNKTHKLYDEIYAGHDWRLENHWAVYSDTWDRRWKCSKCLQPTKTMYNCTKEDFMKFDSTSQISTKGQRKFTNKKHIFSPAPSKLVCPTNEAHEIVAEIYTGHDWTQEDHWAVYKKKWNRRWKCQNCSFASQTQSNCTKENFKEPTFISSQTNLILNDQCAIFGEGPSLSELHEKPKIICPFVIKKIQEFRDKLAKMKAKAFEYIVE